MVATINGDPTTRMAFCWFTNEGVKEGVVQIRDNGQRTKDIGQWITIPATVTTTVPLHYAISSSGLLKAAKIDKNTAFRYESHKALAENLQPGTEYYWRVGYEGHWSEIGHFRTADKEQGEFSFIYMTDSHIQNKEYVDAARLCADAVARYEKDARFCVFPGDFVDTGTENNSEWEWERWFEEALKPVIRTMPLVPTDGNHDDSPLLNYSYHFNTDTSFNQQTQIRPQFSGIIYSFVYGDMQLLAFSMQDFWRGEYDYAARTSEFLERDLGGWFKRQVAAHPEAAWRVGLVHKNLFSGSDHQRDKETPLLRATMLPVMKECDIRLVLQGHDHCYEVIGPVDSTLYFIGATCGAKRYTPLTREEMEASKHIHQVDNYFDLFQQPFAQPGAPSYTRVTVNKERLLLETFKVLPDGTTELFNTITILN
jgi:3',5'-cyclic AMP phosphodiesterase CpdA